MKIAVDFDGTLVDHCFPQIGEEVPGALNCLHMLQEQGDRLVLNTMRSGVYLEQAVSWLVDRGITLSGINQDPGQTEWTQSPKVFAHCYIDDAALGCPLRMYPGFHRLAVDWEQVEVLLQRLRGQPTVAIRPRESNGTPQ